MKMNLFLGIGFVSWISVAVASDKPRTVAAALSTLGAIEHVAQLESKGSDSAPDPRFKARVAVKVRKLCGSLGVQELAVLAVACSAIYYPGNAEDIGYDEAFYAGFWGAVERLAAEKTEANYRALLFVRDRSRLVGGETTLFDGVLKRFQQERNIPK